MQFKILGAYLNVSSLSRPFRGLPHKTSISHGSECTYRTMLLLYSVFICTIEGIEPSFTAPAFNWSRTSLLVPIPSSGFEPIVLHQAYSTCENRTQGNKFRLAPKSFCLSYFLAEVSISIRR
jgi:hypothetical protein